MKKRVIALVCTLALVVGVCAMALTPDVKASTGAFEVGFSRVDINPWADPYDLDKDGSKGDILALPLRGHGNTKYRRSTTTLIDDNGDGQIMNDGSDGLFASCVAVTDDDGDTVIIMSVAIIGGFTNMVEDTRAGIVAALKEKGIDIPAQNIQIQGTHTHSSVDLAVYTSSLAKDTKSYYLLDKNGNKIDDQSLAMTGQQIYANFEIWYPYLIDQMTKCGVEAVTNRDTATMSKGQIDAGDAATEIRGEKTVMNTVRHYTRVESTTGEVYVRGSNFNGASIDYQPNGDGTADTVSGSAELAAADDTLYCLKFDFADENKKDIALVNWRAHTTQNDRDGTGDRISSCYPNRISKVLSDANYESVFIQGAAGNINPSSALYGSWCGSSHHKDANGDGLWLGNELTGNIYGEVVGQVALKCLNENMQAMSAGDIRVTNMVFNSNGKSYDELIMYYAGKTVNTLYNHVVDGTLASSKLTYPFMYPHDMFSNFNEGDTLKPEFETVLKAEYDAAVAAAGDDADKLAAVVDMRQWAKDMRSAILAEQVSDAYIIASKFHASDIPGNYQSDTKQSVDLTAFMLGDNVAFVTAPGEMYDRYNSNISWEDLKGKSQKEIYDILSATNEWNKIKSSVVGGSYGTPFVMGYANRHIGYMPNTIAYEYNKNSTFAAVGSYEAHCTELDQGEDEHILDVYASMLGSLVGGDSANNELYKNGYCQNCEKDVAWEPMSARYNAAATMQSGHYHLVADTNCDQKSVAANGRVCLDLEGKTAQGATRFLYLGNGVNAVVSIQDSVGGGVVKGQGATGITTSWGGGTLLVGGGNTLNIYGGTFQQVIDEKHFVKYGGVLYTRGTINMYGGTLKGGQTWYRGATVDVVTDSNGTGVFNLYGGTVENGSEQVRYYEDGTAYPSVFTYGTCINNASQVNLSGDANVADIYVKNADGLKITNAYTGTANLTYASAPAAGEKIGVSKNAVLNTKITITGTDCIATVSGDTLVAGTAQTCACGESVVINELNQKLWDAYGGDLPSAHYKLTGDITARLAKAGVTLKSQVCLDLAGNDISVTTGRLYIIDNGGAVKIYDSSADESGSIAGNGTTSGGNGGIFQVGSGAALELHGGTITGGTGTYGGNIAVGTDGVFRMYGGNITDGTATSSGGNLQVLAGGSFYAYGGNITGGTAPTDKGNCVRVSANEAGTVQLTNGANIEQISYASSAIKKCPLTISGTYTGTTQLQYVSSLGISVNKVIGTAVNNANIGNANISIAGKDGLMVVIDGGNLKVTDRIAATIKDAAGNQVAYSTLREAIGAYQGTGEILVLGDDVNEANLTISADMIVDLNGSSFNKAITIDQGVTLTCMDSQTKDFDVTDGVFTKLPASMAANAVAAEGYVKYTHGDNTASFHKIATNAENIYFRPQAAGLYYGSLFMGDVYAAQEVESFGVALSIKGSPIAGNGIAEHAIYSVFDGSLFEPGNQSEFASTILTDVLSEQYSSFQNKKNGETVVYGCSYIKLKNGDYVFSDVAGVTLKAVIEYVNDNWSAYAASHEKIFDLYERFPAVINTWETDVIAQKYEENR